jgi:hypothetical protein
VTETAVELPTQPGRSLLEVGSLFSIGALAIGAVLGVIAVLDADSTPAGFGIGLGIAALIFFSGATIACALACLARGRMQSVALVSLVAACVTIDLLVLAIVLDIENEAYGKLVGTAFVLSFFGLIVLGLALAVSVTEGLERIPYVGALATAAAGALISIWLVVTAGGEEESAETVFPSEEPSGGITSVGVGFGPDMDDALLEALGADLVLLAAFWFAALAAGRLVLRR